MLSLSLNLATLQPSFLSRWKTLVKFVASQVLIGLSVCLCSDIIKPCFVSAFSLFFFFGLFVYFFLCLSITMTSSNVCVL